jgi:Na+-driven multidrug efflux pump
MENFWRALGLGLIKLLVSLFSAFGVGLLVLGIVVEDDPRFWDHRYPPSGLFLAIGAGLLTAAALMVVFFLVPLWSRKIAAGQVQMDEKEAVHNRRAEYGMGADWPREDRFSRFKSPPE